MLNKVIYEMITRNEKYEIVKEKCRKYDPINNVVFGKPQITYHVNERNGEWCNSYKTLREARQAFNNMDL